ncbi:MAG: SDR family NAD(P)-dependent oxidoreductase [Opitutaceae bacterium]|nr:SDR family NAD(P)-dependent oxidoreductase [Opitutaceae bacterium]
MDSEFDIAIVGMAARFPGARNVEEFWQNLAQGNESIARLSDEEIIAAGVSPDVLTRADYVKAAAVLDDPGLFDAAFFGYLPGEAATLDPQHRLLLELAHIALEDAGCDPGRYRGPIGVFAGSAMNTYFLNRGFEGGFAENYIPTLVATDKDFLATRISYKLGLRGPSLTVQTACSTSLVAVHLARQSLLNEETDMALAGAVSVRVPHRAGYFYDGSGVVSRDGHVRAFDAAANGTVFGSGAGVLVLKRLADALAQGDRIHAVIKGSAINNDGADKAGYTAPSVNGQAAAVVEALANAGVDAGEISYVEAHGSGTPVGDRIELLALTKAFRNFTPRTSYCAIGSVKTNVGHLDAAAGMAGIIKTVLALQHRRIPATLNFTKPNEEIDFPTTPFFVSAKAQEWRDDGLPRRAGVMATGMGGTNAFVVLEEAPAAVAPAVPAPSGPHLLVISAKTPTALDAAARNFADVLDSPPAKDADGDFLSRVAHTLQTGRRLFAHRRFVVSQGCEDAAGALRGKSSTKAVSGSVPRDGAPPVVFLLPGMGDHYVGMGRGLYERFEVFRQEVDRCAQFLQPILGADIRDGLFPPGEEKADAPAVPRGIDLKRMLGRGTNESSTPAGQNLERTITNQPVLFTVEYALARLWMHWGVEPERLVGHSMGEYVAACLAGVFSLEDALRLIAVRAQLVNDLPSGAMLAVMLPERDVLPLLGPALSIALINGPNLCVVAGPVAAIADFQNALKELGAIFRPVRNRHAFHSRMLDPMVDAFANHVEQVRLSAPRIPFISNITGTWITAEQAVDPRYWAEHARSTARFSDALEQVWKLSDRTFIEVGPGRTLGVLAMQHPARPAGRSPLIVSSLRHDYENQPDAEFILNSLGRLWLVGTDIAWGQLEPPAARQKISLPTYPFERLSCWIGPRASRRPESGRAKADLADWCYVPSWQRTDFFTGEPGEEKSPHPLWLIFADEPALAEQLCGLLVERNSDVVVVRFGSSHARTSEDAWEIRPACFEDHVKLFAAIKGRAAGGLNVIHLGAISPRVKPPGAGHDPHSEELGFHSLMTFAQALGEQNIGAPVCLAAVTAQVHEVTGEESLNPAGATVVGLSGVIPKEYPGVTSFAIDLPDVAPAEEWAPRLLDEFRHPAKGRVIAYRGRFRWERTFRAEKLPALAMRSGGQAPFANGLRTKGVYLITGGTGGLGRAIAKHLAQTCQARLVLTQRTPFPAKAEWKSRLASGALSDSEKRIVEALLEIEALGGEVEVHACEVSDQAGMRRVVAEIMVGHGALHGVIHAAGILREGLIQLKTRDVAEAVLRPKVQGTAVLFDVVRDLNPDWIVLFSSVSSVAAYHGQGDYCAANAFLDAFVHYANAHADFPTIAINWPAWREVGILTEMKTPAGLEGRRETVRQQAILTKDGVEMFQRIVAAKMPQVIVSPRDLEFVIAEAAAPLPEAGPRDDGIAAPAAMQRTGVVDEPRDEVEKAVAAIWIAALSMAPIGVHESFLDLGGHSLLAMRIVAQIRAAYQIDFTLRQFFESSTIAGTALAIQAEVLAEIESLPEEAASRPAS